MATPIPKPEAHRAALLAGELSIYLGESPERVDVPTRGVVNVPAGTSLQSANRGDVDLLV